MVNSLKIKLHLNSDSYKPYKKPDDRLLYIHTFSNPSSEILKQLTTASINNLLKEYEQAKVEYEEAPSKQRLYQCQSEIPKTNTEGDIQK